MFAFCVRLGDLPDESHMTPTGMRRSRFPDGLFVSTAPDRMISVPVHLSSGEETMSRKFQLPSGFRLPDDFRDVLAIENAAERLDEAMAVAEKSGDLGVALLPVPDHAAIFTDPPHLVAGPLKTIGYELGWDSRCYPSPVDGCDYINVAARLDTDSEAYSRGWFRYVAIVHPVDEAARQQMLSQGYGNPCLHHVTLGIVPPVREADDDLVYAGLVVESMVDTRSRMAEVIGEKPGTLICALPENVINDSRFSELSARWVEGLEESEFQFESMQGGGFLIQYFVLAGGRIEVALRSGTRQTFNPRSVKKISRDEISTYQGDGVGHADSHC